MSPSTLKIWNFRHASGVGGETMPPHAYLTDPVNAPVPPAVLFVARGPINGSITKLFGKVLVVGSTVQFARVACGGQRREPDGPGPLAQARQHGLLQYRSLNEKKTLRFPEVTQKQSRVLYQVALTRVPVKATWCPQAPAQLWVVDMDFGAHIESQGWKRPRVSPSPTPCLRKGTIPDR